VCCKTRELESVEEGVMRVVGLKSSRVVKWLLLMEDGDDDGMERERQKRRTREKAGIYQWDAERVTSRERVLSSRSKREAGNTTSVTHSPHSLTQH